MNPQESSQELPQDRRNFLKNSSLLAGCAASGGAAAIELGRQLLAAPYDAAAPSSPTSLASKNQDPPKMQADVRYCLNMSTIHGEKIDVVDQIKIASKAGYTGIELWLRDVERYLQGGGDLIELRKRIQDAGLVLESSIAFGQWIVDDEAARTKGLDQAARDMDKVRRLGGRRIAAPPAGATDGGKLDLDRAAERYRALLELGDQYDCTPQLEVWGFSKNLAHLREVLYVTSACGHPKACILPDVYHLYKGGSNFTELGLLSGSRVHVFHMNDYPNVPPRDKINDADRVYPTDGVAPLNYILRTMISNGFRGVLSLELFNRTYWEQDPNEVAATGLGKMKKAVEQAMS